MCIPTAACIVCGHLQHRLIGVLCYPSAIDPHITPDPANTRVIFDLHGVLFKAQFMHMFRTIFTSGQLLLIMRYALNPFCIWAFIRGIRSQKSPEGIIHDMIREFPALQPILPLAIEVMKAQKPIYSTLKIVHELKKIGYKVDILSNAGRDMISDLFIHYSDIFRPFDQIVMSGFENNYCSKPHDCFYQYYLNFHKKHAHTLIFIDDRTNNVLGACRNGMIGIHYQTYKQLHAALNSLGILHSSP